MSILSIIDNEELYWGSIVKVGAAKPGKYDVRLIYREMDENNQVSSPFKYATICPYFEIITETLDEIVELLVKIKEDPFNKEARQKLADSAFLNNPPFKRTLKLSFSENKLENKVIWFCNQDGLKPGSHVTLAAVEYDVDLDNLSEWRLEE